ncbi:MAG: response regulator transcription factor [Clostridiales bacterium]|nr:response regulator transcription factor [Clostridiales bacterium]
MARILIIEDNMEIHQMEKDLLGKSGYETVSAFSGTEALIYVEREAFDLIVLDLMLPGLPGDEVLKKIRQENNTAILCVTAVDSVESKVKLMKLGADDYLVKPFHYEEFLVRVEALLRRSLSSASAFASKSEALTFRDILIEPDSRKVTVSGTEVELTKKEYEILELMVRYPQKVFTKENIFETVWGESYLPEDNSVNVHVSNIRKKLSAAGGAEDYIKTIWGIGYKLSEAGK